MDVSIEKQIKDNTNLIQTINSTIASISLDQLGKKVAGKLVTPAVWLVNHTTKIGSPSSVDVGIYLSGFVSGGASTAVSLVKAVVDDRINQKLDLVKAKEPEKYAPHNKACYYYGLAAPQINAMRIASEGGTAWISDKGLWVYITDACNNLVRDYTPSDYVRMFRPKKPLKEDNQGLVDFEVIRK